MVEVLPEAARPVRFVATPWIVAGVKATVPSRADVAISVCVANSLAGGQGPCDVQGGSHV